MGALVPFPPVEVPALAPDSAHYLAERLPIESLLGPLLGTLIQRLNDNVVPGSQWPIIIAFFVSVMSGLLGPHIRVGVGDLAPAWKDDGQCKLRTYQKSNNAKLDVPVTYASR